jgi:hypothetical protein
MDSPAWLAPVSMKSITTGLSPFICPSNYMSFKTIHSLIDYGSANHGLSGKERRLCTPLTTSCLLF